MEALVPDRARTPWLGLPGLTVTGIVFLLGVVGRVGAGLLEFVLPDPVFVSVWVSTGVDLVLAAAVTAVIWRWSRTAGWSAAHRLALAAGATLTYVWHGFLQQPLAGSMGITKLLGNLVFAIGACVLFVVAARRVRTTREALSPDARAS